MNSLTNYTMTASHYIDEYSGFFNGSTPTEDDVESYFNAENFTDMFGSFELPSNLSFDDLQAEARRMIKSRVGPATK